MMTSIANAGSYVRSAQAFPSTTTLTRADALPVTDTDAGTAGGNAQPGFVVSDLKKLDMSGLKIMSVRDNPKLHDLMATNWLTMRAADAAFVTAVPDNAPQNIYATVKVDGKVVATLYNAGSSAMTNEAAGKVGDLQEPPNLIGGPDLAQWRAERIAKAVGGTVEKAATAITQSAWQPRQSASTNYTREQLDAAFEAMMAEGQTAIAQRRAGYSASSQTPGYRTDINA
jgi:hypothetical protein